MLCLRSHQVVPILLVQEPYFEQQDAGIFICPALSPPCSEPWKPIVRPPSTGTKETSDYKLDLANEEHRQEIRGQKEDEVQGFYFSGDRSLLGCCGLLVFLYQGP